MTPDVGEIEARVSQRDRDVRGQLVLPIGEKSWVAQSGVGSIPASGTTTQ